jgi:hypothetical protein
MLRYLLALRRRSSNTTELNNQVKHFSTFTDTLTNLTVTTVNWATLAGTHYFSCHSTNRRPSMRVNTVKMHKQQWTKNSPSFTMQPQNTWPNTLTSVTSQLNRGQLTLRDHFSPPGGHRACRKSNQNSKIFKNTHLPKWNLYYRHTSASAKLHPSSPE